MSDQNPTTRGRFGPRLAVLGIFALLAIALPLIFLNPEGPNWYHLLFHLIGIPLCALGIWLSARLARSAPTRLLTVMSGIVTGGLVIWAIGHTGELVMVLANGGAEAEQELFDDPVHRFFASIAIPGWLLSILAIVALGLAAGVRGLRRRTIGRRSARPRVEVEPRRPTGGGASRAE